MDHMTSLSASHISYCALTVYTLLYSWSTYCVSYYILQYFCLCTYCVQHYFILGALTVFPFKSLGYTYCVTITIT